MLDFTYENECRAKGYKSICGIDEAGRGPLAGNVVAAAVILPDAHMIDGFGPAPAYGMWVRHADGIVLDRYRIIPEGADSRPGIVMEAE